MRILKFNDNDKVLIASDFHFNHCKLVSSCEKHFDRYRNYVTTDEMDQDIINKWNSIVDSNTIVIFLGDLLMNCPVKETSNKVHEYLSKLNKPKEFYWIIGNHDHLIRKKCDNIHMKDWIKFEYKGRTYICQHYGFNAPSTNDFNGGVQVFLQNETDIGNSFDVYVHGHTHSDQKTSKFTFNGKEYTQNCVCWDAWYNLVNPEDLVKG